MKKWYEEKQHKDMLFYGAMMLMVISPFLEGFGIITSMLAVFIAFYSTDDDDES
ncbi:hypothetical protein N7X58_00440 [Leuconostoc mesenteroides]|jgi:hypothetical protein|uniref:Uncharacterized protein n=1 Tax=Leuconostoc mesenteroides subsp. mesenteroides (strain ATCC 8293 / DSM 20343 / BCRC 11652 / CCM 1803 / JCM 6124 / NCDO 523 / NBRC 100496 / NCIMB 8023 / NCTC 12954 / NRRL B-1118 / 37Y) TaxID=203120 RepID=Q03UR7_LEUMM|nr:hypothetical protein [Leuconostoc mesenteroides]ABJ63055.1 hypothetical protein LEUM_1985 [Leuconostoc mesenteroides subsp. mesenteroides ATCC 8293]MCJ2159917.1 hypothetical protein [Leuconostoc mesenteroides]MCM6836424.1 hypothetical protein [Leuconostoc mesenteroides]MCU4663978.1 hypothetical protein [Leuconostoc mesenteroides]MDG9746776.1 hypothetical protein [Leuconostoc mesenteroides]